MKVQLSLVERTLNRLTAATRKRAGDVLTRMQAEADFLREAFETVRQEEREACAKVAETRRRCCWGDGPPEAACHLCREGQHTAAAIRARGNR